MKNKKELIKLLFFISAVVAFMLLLIYDTVGFVRFMEAFHKVRHGFADFITGPLPLIRDTLLLIYSIINLLNVLKKKKRKSAIDPLETSVLVFVGLAFFTGIYEIVLFIGKATASVVEYDILSLVIGILLIVAFVIGGVSVLKNENLKMKKLLAFIAVGLVCLCFFVLFVRVFIAMFSGFSGMLLFLLFTYLAVIGLSVLEGLYLKSYEFEEE